MDTKGIYDLKRDWYLYILDLLISIDEIDKWQFPYFRTRYSNNVFFEDLDPVISLVNFNQTHIIKIIQDSNIIFNDLISEFDDKKMLVIVTEGLYKNKSSLNKVICAFIQSIK